MGSVDLPVEEAVVDELPDAVAELDMVLLIGVLELGAEVVSEMVSELVDGLALAVSVSDAALVEALSVPSKVNCGL